MRRERVPNHSHSSPGFEQLSSQWFFHANIYTACVKTGGQKAGVNLMLKEFRQNLLPITSLSEIRKRQQIGERCRLSKEFLVYLSVSLEYLMRFLSGESKDWSFSLRSFPLSLNLHYKLCHNFLSLYSVEIICYSFCFWCVLFSHQ